MQTKSSSATSPEMAVTRVEAATSKTTPLSRVSERMDFFLFFFLQSFDVCGANAPSFKFSAFFLFQTPTITSLLEESVQKLLYLMNAYKTLLSMHWLGYSLKYIEAKSIHKRTDNFLPFPHPLLLPPYLFYVEEQSKNLLVSTLCFLSEVSRLKFILNSFRGNRWIEWRLGMEDDVWRGRKGNRKWLGK